MKKQYLRTERTHFMCPNMHFGMLMELEKEYEEERVKETLHRMAEAHPFLRSVVAYEDGTDQLYYKVTEHSQIDLVIRKNKSALWSDYSKLAVQDWNVFEEGMLKVFVYFENKQMTLLFVAHHLLADGRGLLELAQEFADVYVGKREPIYVEEHLIENIGDLPEKSSLTGISKMLVRRANATWKKENHTVSYEQYRSFAVKYGKEHPVEYKTYEADAVQVKQMKEQCREHGFTMNDLLMAHMYITTGASKIIIASDIRNRLSKYQKGALGNYATALGIVCKTNTKDTVKKAIEAHKAVQKSKAVNRKWMLVLACYFEMSPTLLDAAAISALGGFESKAGSFVGKRMFGMGKPESYSITNLGKVENENIQSILFIPPASPAAKLTLGVVTLNGVMRLCSSKNS